ncbi:hypothetical protein SVIOM342S_09321 [Streptomyces violaceorubidus]
MRWSCWGPFHGGRVMICREVRSRGTWCSEPAAVRCRPPPGDSVRNSGSRTGRRGYLRVRAGGTRTGARRAGAWVPFHGTPSHRSAPPGACTARKVTRTLACRCAPHPHGDAREAHEVRRPCRTGGCSPPVPRPRCSWAPRPPAEQRPPYRPATVPTSSVPTAPERSRAPTSSPSRTTSPEPAYPPRPRRWPSATGAACATPTRSSSAVRRRGDGRPRERAGRPSPAWDGFTASPSAGPAGPAGSGSRRRAGP